MNLYSVISQRSGSARLNLRSGRKLNFHNTKGYRTYLPLAILCTCVTRGAERFSLSGSALNGNVHDVGIPVPLILDYLRNCEDQCLEGPARGSSIECSTQGRRRYVGYLHQPSGSCGIGWGMKAEFLDGPWNIGYLEPKTYINGISRNKRLTDIPASKHR
ncbi:unnamed protein product [Tuber aestivum]|uniref:Uncharacterized protein n=1 Tax=Tuber aestivum TaxID=59557 RepID=A0A292PI72_9PEZI|nr:unnamed protein product [Tuber aestivum]